MQNRLTSKESKKKEKKAKHILSQDTLYKSLQDDKMIYRQIGLAQGTGGHRAHQAVEDSKKVMSCGNNVYYIGSTVVYLGKIKEQ